MKPFSRYIPFAKYLDIKIKKNMLKHVKKYFFKRKEFLAKSTLGL